MSPAAISKIVLVNELDVCLWLHTKENPTDQEWNEGCQQLLRLKEQRNGNTSTVRQLVVTDGGSPNAKQRSKLLREIFREPARCAAVTMSLSDPIKRGVTTAIRWLNPSFRAVHPTHWHEAFLHLGLHPSAITVLLPELLLLQANCPEVKTLKMLTEVALASPPTLVRPA